MPQSQGPNVEISYLVEATPGVTPAGTPKILRTTSKAINLGKDMLTSNERRGSRQRSVLRHGFHRVGGSPGFELGLKHQDDWLEALMGGTWTAITTLTADIAATATGYSRVTGNFITEGFEVGDWVVAAGYTNAANNGQSRITAVTATTLTVAKNPATAVEAGGAGKTVALVGRKLKIGSTLRTFSVERRFKDIGKYQVFRGVNPNTGNFTLSPGGVIGGTYDLLGLSSSAISGVTLGAPTAAPVSDPFDGFTGALYEGNTLMGVMTALTVSINNNRTLQPVFGSKVSPSVYEGEVDVTGRLSVMFEDEVMYNKFLNETESNIDVRLDDVGGVEFMRMRLPRLKYTGGDMDPPRNGPVILDMPFTSLEDTTGNTVTIQRSNATSV